MLIGPKSRHQAPSSVAKKLKFGILGSELGVVTKTMYLGAQVDNSLNWKESIKRYLPKFPEPLDV